MSMAILTRRLQVLLDDERMDRLEHLARERGTSVAALIRHAIDVVYPDAGGGRQRTAEEFLAADPMAVDDWTTMKQDRAALLGRT